MSNLLHGTSTALRAQAQLLHLAVETYITLEHGETPSPHEQAIENTPSHHTASELSITIIASLCILTGVVLESLEHFQEPVMFSSP